MYRYLTLLWALLSFGPADAAIVSFTLAAEHSSWAQAGSVTASDADVVPADQPTYLGATSASAADAIYIYDIGCRCQVPFGVSADAETTLDIVVDPAAGSLWSFGAFGTGITDSQYTNAGGSVIADLTFQIDTAHAYELAVTFVPAQNGTNSFTFDDFNGNVISKSGADPIDIALTGLLQPGIYQIHLGVSGGGNPASYLYATSAYLLSMQLDPVAVPLPGAAWLSISALGVLGWRSRRR